jgi:broad specificity polyphosphatase/5'/3'-nucleotidase SurE
MPADSASAGLFGLVPDGVTIDLIASGANDGEDVSLFTNASRTVGAALFGLRCGTPAVA